jgi:hypothetical protein
MGLRLFTDHCISIFIIQELLKAGHEVFKLKDYIPVESSDQKLSQPHRIMTRSSFP